MYGVIAMRWAACPSSIRRDLRHEERPPFNGAVCPIRSHLQADGWLLGIEAIQFRSATANATYVEIRKATLSGARLAVDSSGTSIEEPLDAQRS